MPTVREVEDKYTVGAEFALPELAGLPGVASVSEPRTFDLDAIYHDTPDLRLLRNGITLRRRTGGEDAGWHLKLPASGGRDEVRRPLGRGAKVPAALAELVTGRTRGAPLGPVARLQTTRTVTELLGDDGQVLAELADDHVRTQLLGSNPTGGDAGQEARDGESWHEIEIELVNGQPSLLRAAGKALKRAGARPAEIGSKVARLLSARATGGPDVVAVGRLRPSSRAGEVVRGYLAAQLDAMLAADPRVRLDEPDSVHKMRVATRRLRSTLRSFAPLLDAERAADLDARLKELAATLGVPRDKEVQLERLLARVDDLPPELVLGPVRDRVSQQLGGERLTGLAAVHDDLRGESYIALVEDLVDFVRTGVQTGGRARKPARKVLPKLVNKRSRRLAKRVELALTLDGAERDEALHSARKAAKRARYAGEAVTAAFGSNAAAFAKRMEAVQEALGEHQDSVVAQDLLREMALGTNTTSGESAFTYGLLVGIEQAAAGDARRDFAKAWKAARKGGTRLR